MIYFAVAVAVIGAIPFGIGVYIAFKSKFTELDAVMWMAAGTAVIRLAGYLSVYP